MGFKQLTATQLPLFCRVHLRRRSPGRVRKHTKSIQRWYLCAGLRRSARTGGGGISAVTAAARPSACMGDSSTRAATAAVRRSACMNGGGAAICQHRRQRAHCRDCNNFVCQIQGCPRQGLPFSGAQSLLGHMRAMHGDNPRTVTKSNELEVHQALRDAN